MSKQVIGSFNPDNNSEKDFTDIWKRILLYTQNFKLDEKAYKDILATVTEGSASNILYEMIVENKPLDIILQTFSDLFTKRRTILTDANEINNFKCKANEPIITAMR